MKVRLAIFLILWAVSAQASATRYLAGNADDARPAKLHGPAFHLQGGGDDVDASLQWMIDQVRGCTDCDTKLDVAVLRATGDNDYNDYLYAMKGVDSVETIVIASRNDALQRDIHKTIRNAEVIFFAGGDQCHYVSRLKGTGVQSAIESVVKRGGGLGGTSAGVAILGDVIYDACKGSTKGFEGLSDPYHESISFTYSFFHLPYLKGTLTDQHLVERDRIGRTFSFLARQIREKKAKSILGLAIERETSIALDKAGKATVMGKGPVYLILADHMPEQCEPGKPLSYSGFKLWKMDSGATFSLKERPVTGYYSRSVRNGIIDGDPYAETPCDFEKVLADIQKADAAQARNALDEVFRKCPHDLQPYSQLEATEDPSYIRKKATDLRRLLSNSYVRERLLYFDLLWTLETLTRNGNPSEWKEDLTEDLKKLESEPDFKGPEAVEMMKRGYRIMSDQEDLVLH